MGELESFTYMPWVVDDFHLGGALLLLRLSGFWEQLTFT